jgi:DNA polymerase III delta subunit
LDSNDAFVKEIEPYVKKLVSRIDKKLGVFDLTQAIVSRQTTRALNILNTLLVNREKPQSILGAIFWQWEKGKDSLNLDKFRQGLKLLLDTDIKIKTGKLEEKLARRWWLCAYLIYPWLDSFFSRVYSINLTDSFV